jgi:hypothetical protein
LQAQRWSGGFFNATFRQDEYSLLRPDSPIAATGKGDDSLSNPSASYKSGLFKEA